MTKQVSLNDLRRMNMTQIMLGSKEVQDKFVSREKVRDALTHNKEILDSHESATGSLDDYNVVDEFDRYSCIEVYKVDEHRTEKRFQMELKDGRVDGESYRIAMIDFVIDGSVVERLFVK